MTALPSVDVVVPTHCRPDLLRAAINSVRTQEYGGVLRVFVVFDDEEPDPTLQTDDGVPVRVLANDRKPGLCGARNTGILAGDGDLVAFLDDDDRWLPDKLARQVELLAARRDAGFATTGIRVDFRDTHTERLAGTDTVTHARLLQSRMSMLHSSTFLIRRAALLGPGGLVDEDAPQGQNEDYEILLRYSALAPVAHLDEPLVAIRWGSSSQFAQAWRSKLDGANWILQRHPDITSSRVGHARVLAQVAFAQAALGERRAALRTAGRAIRMRWREPRSYLAVSAALGVSPSTIMTALHRRGRGV